MLEQYFFLIELYFLKASNLLVNLIRKNVSKENAKLIYKLYFYFVFFLFFIKRARLENFCLRTIIQKNKTKPKQNQKQKTNERKKKILKHNQECNLNIAPSNLKLRNFPKFSTADEEGVKTVFIVLKENQFKTKIPFRALIALEDAASFPECEIYKVIYLFTYLLVYIQQKIFLFGGIKNQFCKSKKWSQLTAMLNSKDLFFKKITMIRKPHKLL